MEYRNSKEDIQKIAKEKSLNIDFTKNDYSNLVINDETYYDVVTDDWTSFWTSVKTFERLSTQIPMDILKSFIISGANVLSHEGMIPISKDFMSYVKENTNHPKFLPKFLLLEKNVIKINEEEQLENVDYSFTPDSQNIELPMSRKR